MSLLSSKPLVASWLTFSKSPHSYNDFHDLLFSQPWTSSSITVPVIHSSLVTLASFLFLCQRSSCFEAFPWVSSSAQNTLFPNIFMFHFLIVFKSLFKCYLFSEVFPGHLSALLSPSHCFIFLHSTCHFVTL